MKRIIEFILYWLARFILVRRDPTVIAVTGSVGKTSAKEAIAVVLKKKFDVRASQENCNNEIGVPLTIIGKETGGRNPFRWLSIIVKGMFTGFFSLPFPKMLVLEMGADKPGDIKYLMQLAPPDVGIVTAITAGPTHMATFKKLEQVQKEKLTMYKQLSKLSTAIVNVDEPLVAPILAQPKFRVFTVGIDAPADLTVVAIEYTLENGGGMRFKFRYQGSLVPCFLPGTIGRPVVYTALFATAVGILYEMNLVDITMALRQYQPPKGRMRMLAGKNESTIIDDTYNAAPAAVEEAVRALQLLPAGGRRVVCLGEMAELGEKAKAAHEAIGKLLATHQIDQLWVIGEPGEWIADAAAEAGLPKEAVFKYATSIEAGEALRDKPESGDFILVKGSQVARMEHVVKAIMARPEEADHLLVRQHGKWSIGSTVS